MSETTPVKRPRKVSATALAKLQSTAVASTPCTAPTPVIPKLSKQQVILAAFKVVALAQTEAARKYVAPVKVSTIDAKAIDIAESISKMSNLCSGAKTDVANLLSVVTGLKVKEAFADTTKKVTEIGLEKCFNPGAVLVPLTQTNGHSYELGRPCILAIGNQAICMANHVGNHLPAPVTASGKVNVRPATLEEFERIFKYFDLLASEDCISSVVLVQMLSII